MKLKHDREIRERAYREAMLLRERNERAEILGSLAWFFGVTIALVAEAALVLFLFDPNISLEPFIR